MITTSTKISQRPRLRRKERNSGFVFLVPLKYAETPARNTKVGAQK